MKFTDHDFDILQLQMTFICEVMSRSIQYFRNESELSEQIHDYDLAQSEDEFATYLDDLLHYIANYYNFKKWCDDRDES